MSSKNIGERIFSIRAKLKLNQREFAKKLETSSGYISGIESGKNMAGGEFLLRLNREFGVDLNWLLTGIGEPFVNTTPAAPVKLAPAAAVLREPQGAYHVEAPLNERERQLLEDFRSANEQGRNAIEDAAKAMAAIAALAKNKVG